MRRIAFGAAAGLAGTAAISLLSSIEARLRGRGAVYEPGAMAGRLAARAGLDLSDRERRWAGRLMRWPYGASWGVALAVLAPERPSPLSAVVLGAAVLGFELVVLPLAGATPALRRWGLEEVASDAFNTLAFGTVSSATLGALERADRAQRASAG